MPSVRMSSWTSLLKSAPRFSTMGTVVSSALLDGARSRNGDAESFVQRNDPTSTAFMMGGLAAGYSQQCQRHESCDQEVCPSRPFL
jgi:hypothetical protein